MYWNNIIFILVPVQLILISRKYCHWIAFFNTFSTLYNMLSLSEKFSLPYIMFEVSDGISFSQHLPLKSTINYLFSDIQHSTIT